MRACVGADSLGRMSGKGSTVVDFTLECEWLGRVTADIRARFCTGVTRGRGSTGEVGRQNAHKDAILALNRGGIWGMWKQTFSSSSCLASALGLCLAVAGSPALGAEHTSMAITLEKVF
jgi:hypothetical protein